jgi:hypothetical protein
MASDDGFTRKVRLNVHALLDEGIVGKFLICIAEDAMIEDLMSKVQAGLSRSNIVGSIVRVTNESHSNLPPDERVGDILRDSESVFVILSRTPPDPNVRAIMGRETANMNIMPSGGGGGDGAFYAVEPSDDEDEGDGRRPDMPPPGPSKAGATSNSLAFAGNSVPGPQECMEADIQPLRQKNVNEGLALKSCESDWLVENLTPKLREYISARFKEAHMSSNNASFISILMKPQGRLGSASAGLPIHYSIARVDVIEFERLCHRNLLRTREQMTYLRKSHLALTTLLKKGLTDSQYAQNMLPYKYKVTQEFEELLEETDQPTFGMAEGFRPMILIDTSGAVGRSLVYVKAALQRMIYSFLASKSKFNLVKFTPQGIAVTWASEMVPPTAQVLREAEEWLDNLKPLRGAPNFMDGLRLALAPSEVDTVFVVAAGLPKRSDVGYILKGIHTLNIRDVPIHVIGVDCEPDSELALRRLAEDNHGSFRMKRFDGSQASAVSSSATSWRSGMGKFEGAGDGDNRMTIGGQLSIIEVMIEEQKAQEFDWLEEQKCANRLLLTTATQQPVPDPASQRDLQRRVALSGVAKLGGGYLYNEDAQDSQLQDLFGAQPLPPWEASDQPMGMNHGHQPPSTGVVRQSTPSRQRQWNTKCGVGSQDGMGGANVVQTQRPAMGSTGSSGVASVRRPSLGNPSGRQPGSAIKVSQLAGRGGAPTGAAANRPLSRGPVARNHGPARAKTPPPGGRPRTPRVGGRQAPTMSGTAPPNFRRERRWSF